MYTVSSAYDGRDCVVLWCMRGLFWLVAKIMVHSAKKRSGFIGSGIDHLSTRANQLQSLGVFEADYTQTHGIRRDIFYSILSCRYSDVHQDL